jgi:hypothetical protein
MTNKEAIRILEGMDEYNSFICEYHDAIRHAIEVLKASEAKVERHKRIKQFLKEGNNVHKKD